MWGGGQRQTVYRASDQVDNEEWLTILEEAGDRLGLGMDARSRSADVFLSTLPEEDRSKRVTVAASLYVGSLVTGQPCSQGEVAEAVGVSRLSVQQRWKDLLADVGFEPPQW